MPSIIWYLLGFVAYAMGLIVFTAR